MDYRRLLDARGGVNAKLAKRFADTINADTVDIDYLNPTLAQRVKYKVYYDGSSKTCQCGKKLQFSSSLGEVFSDSCGHIECRPKIDRKKSIEKFKRTRLENKTKRISREYSNEEVRNHIKERISENKMGYFIAGNSDIVKFIKARCEYLGLYPQQYAYHVLLEDMTTPKCSCGNGRSFKSFTKGYKKYCGPCSKKLIAPSNREKNKINVLSEKINNERPDLNVVEVYPINKKPWIMKCNNCVQEFSVRMNNGVYIDEIKCPICYPVNNKSFIEYEILEKLRDCYTGEIIHTYKIPGTKNRGSYKTLDLYFPEFKLAVELNGRYWHSDDKYRHNDRRKLCAEKSITLLQFTDVDTSDNLDIVMSMIKNKLHLNEKVFARKTLIKEITSKVYRNFCEANHIKGHARASLKLGAFLGDKLVSVFSLSKSRFEKDVWECIRFCSLKGVTVVGVLGKFIKHIERHTNINSFVTYCDLHYSDGKSYKKFFELIKTTQPNYFYWKGEEIRHRQEFQKHKLEAMFPNSYNAALTEKEIAEKEGYRRYYDCGNLKFLWSRT